MKKKLVAVIMATTLLSLSGCVSINVNNYNESDKEVAEEIIESSSENASQVQEEQTPENSETVTHPETASNYLDVEFDYFVDSCYEDISLMYGHYNTIRLNNTEFPALLSAVNEYNETLSAET